MTDAISRSTLQKEFDEKCIHDCEFCPWYLHWTTEDLEREGTCVLIQKAAAIDAAPVVHAMWKNGRTCTACGGEAFYTEWTSPLWDYDWNENLVQMGEDHHVDYIPTPYCPNCGAKMDGEENDA